MVLVVIIRQILIHDTMNPETGIYRTRHGCLIDGMRRFLALCRVQKDKIDVKMTAKGGYSCGPD